MNENRWKPPQAPVEVVPPRSDARLHKRTGIAVATLVGGPIAAAYLVYDNFKQLGLRDKARRSLVWFCLGSCLFWLVAWHTPIDLISQFIAVTLPSLISVVLAVQFLQGEIIATHRLSGCAFRSVWFGFVIGVAANVAARGLFYVLSL